MSRKKSVIILASANSFGNTKNLVDIIASENNFDIIDIKPLNINHFDYEYKNEGDDFLPLIKKVIDNYDNIILATPVYWYTMSGHMKMFLDRISDLLYHHKETGRKLRGKSMAVISSTNNSEVKEGFYMPFQESAKYLGMHYVGNVHCLINNGIISKETEERINKFVDKLQQ